MTGLKGVFWKISTQRSALALLAMAPMLAHGGDAPAQPSNETANQPPNQSAAEVTVSTTLRYLLALPRDYDASNRNPGGDDEDTRWPLVLFLHGAGERGDNIERVKAWGPPRMIEAGESIPAVVVSPQCPAGRWWRPHELLSLLDHIEATHRIDSGRIYVTGLSMGGFGTWDLIGAAPERFAAAVPVCGGASGPIRLLSRVRETPVWAFHGTEDGVVLPSASAEAVEAVRRGGGEAKLTMYEGVGHDSWRNAYADEAMWDWMFAQRRARNANGTGNTPAP